MHSDAAAFDVNNPPPLTRRFKAVFASGSMAEAIVFSTTGQFALLYYNQVLGVRPDLVGLAIAAGLIFNALFEPFIGSWSDRTRSRFGRRHPFMFVAILPITISFWAMFSPPSGLDHTGELIWLAACNTVLLQALTAFHTPHLAFGGELSPNYTERSRVMSWNTFFLWAGDTAVWLLSFAWFFRATAGHPNGALQASKWPNYIGFAASFVFIALTVSSVFTRSRIPYVQQAPARRAALQPGRAVPRRAQGAGQPQLPHAARRLPLPFADQRGSGRALALLGDVFLAAAQRPD